MALLFRRTWNLHHRILLNYLPDVDSGMDFGWDGAFSRIYRPPHNRPRILAITLLFRRTWNLQHRIMLMTGGQIVTVSGWCLFSPASVRREYVKWIEKGRAERHDLSNSFNLRLKLSSEIVWHSDTAATHRHEETDLKWTEEVWADRHCVWMVLVLSSQCPETVREVDCGRGGADRHCNQEIVEHVG